MSRDNFGYAAPQTKGVASSSVAAANAFHRYQAQKGAAPEIELEDGWATIHVDGIMKLQRILNHGKGTFPNREYIQLYTYVRPIAALVCLRARLQIFSIAAFGHGANYFSKKNKMTQL